MKCVLFLSGFFLFSFSVFCQNTDTLAIARKVDSLLYISQIRTEQCDFDKALEFNAAAEKLALEKLGRKSVAYGSCCYNRGRVNWKKNDYPEAEKWLIESIAIREEVLGKNHPEYAWTLSGLGQVYSFMGNYEQAEKLLLESLPITEKASGKENPVYAINLHRLAYTYHLMGNYEKAESLYLQSLAIKEKVLGKEDSGYANTLENLALLYQVMGNYKKAEPLYLESLAIRELTLGKEDPDYASSLNGLALLYQAMRNYEKAEPLYLEALLIFEKALGRDNSRFAAVLFNLAFLYRETGNYEKSEPLFLEGKAIEGKLLGQNHPYYALDLTALALLYTQKGNYTEAEPLYLEAKVIQEKALGKEHPDYADNLNNLVCFYEKQHRFSASEPLLAEVSALQQARLLKSTSFLSEWELARYAATFQLKGDNLYAYTLARLSQVVRKTDQTGVLPVLAFGHALFYKGFLLTAAARRNALAAASPESEETNLRLKIYRRRLAAEYAKPIAERKGVEELEEKANATEKELASRLLGTGYGDAIRQVNWQEVQAALKKDEAAVEFVYFQVNFPKTTDSTMYAALVLRPGSKQPAFIPLFEEKQLDSLLSAGRERRQDYLNHIYASASRGLEPLRLKKLTGLYELIWKPLEKDLRKVKTVYYSPSGLLHRLNLGAIPLPAGKKGRREQTLADRYRLVQVGSTRQLAVPASVQPAANDIALFGGIVYDADTAALPAASSEALASRTRGELSFTYTDSTLRSGTSWYYLSGTEREVQAVSDIARSAGMTVQAFTGAAATEEALKSLGTTGKSSPRILHLATHGFFFPDPKNSPSPLERGLGGEAEPVFRISDHPMIRSGLILAGGNHAWKTGKPIKEGLEDGILTAYEISQMNLSNTELVVLSACETGLGDIQGNEGVYGLQRAFKIAGAKYLIMSLWQVPDKQTSLLMTTFYRKWLEEKMAIPEAFRTAQKELREAGLDPYQWAGFVLVE